MRRINMSNHEPTGLEEENRELRDLVESLQAEVKALKSTIAVLRQKNTELTKNVEECRNEKEEMDE